MIFAESKVFSTAPFLRVRQRHMVFGIRRLRSPHARTNNEIAGTAIFWPLA